MTGAIDWDEPHPHDREWNAEFIKEIPRAEEEVANLAVTMMEMTRATPCAPWLVTSTIYPTSAPLSYTQTRSVFSPIQRFGQTLETISSIRRFQGADIKILVVESSCISPLEKRGMERAGANVIELEATSLLARVARGPYKGMAEALITAAFLRATPPESSLACWKISGRYTLSSSLYEVPGYGADESLFGSCDWNPDLLSSTCYRVTRHERESLAQYFLDQLPSMILGFGLEKVLTQWAINRGLYEARSALPVEGLLAVSGMRSHIQ